MAATKLFLIRHAEVEERYHKVFGGRIDMGLSRRGQEQAKQLRLMKSVEQGRRQPPVPFDLVAGGRDRRADGFGTGDHMTIAGQFSRNRNQHVQL